MKKTFKDLLIEFNACSPAIDWTKDKTIEQVVTDCHRGDWLLWLAQRLELPLNKLTLAKARCAKTVIHLIKDQRSINAINIAEKFGLNECTLEELSKAADAAADAYAAAYADAAAAVYAAEAAAYADAAYAAAAAYAAYAAAADADADAAYAAYAADTAAAAAYAAAADTAYAADTAADTAADARTKNQKETADICRDILGQLIIDKVNELLKTNFNTK